MALTLPQSGGGPLSRFHPPVSAPKQVAFILDKSGSMSTQRERVISAFNEFLNDLKGAQGVSVTFWLTLFDTVVTTPVHGINVGEVEPLSIPRYVPGGNTALYDALGQTLNQMERRLDGDESTPIVVCILTDGQENSSKEFDEKQIREKIAALNSRPNWTFTFMGADQDAWVAARLMGIPAMNTMSYDQDQTQDAMFSNSQRVVGHLQSSARKSETLYEGATDLRKKKGKK